jgi:hypothetical protein
MNTNDDNALMPVNEVNPLLLKPYVLSSANRCNGCGMPNPKYFNVKWQLYVCGADTCKPHDIMRDWTHHAMTGE